MDMIGRSNNEMESASSSGGLNRRAVLMTAAVGAGAAVGVSTVLAETAAAANFGAPLVELQVPAGVLTLEQKAAMIKGITDVVLKATSSRRIRPGNRLCRFLRRLTVASASTVRFLCRAANRPAKRCSRFSFAQHPVRSA
jgi:hypothetical protein